MAKTENDHDTMVDYITGKTVPNVGTEEIRQRVEKFLVEERGYSKEAIAVDADIAVEIDGEKYTSQLDLVVSAEGSAFMVVKCAAGSLESREREVVSAARIFASHPLPRAVVTDSQTAVVYDVISGKKISQGLEAIPSFSQALELLSGYQPPNFSDIKKKKEKIIYRSYDSMNVNTQRNVG
jgi:hypothetical protein